MGLQLVKKKKKTKTKTKTKRESVGGFDAPLSWCENDYHIYDSYSIA